MRCLAALTVLALSWCSTPVPARAQVDAATLEARVEFSLAPLVEARDLSGVIAFRTGDGPIRVISLGYADWESGARFSDRTRFPAGSMTRTLTRAMADRMLEADLLRLGDPLDRYLPDLAGAGSLTVADLVNRTGRIDPVAASRTAWLPPEAASANAMALDDTALARVIEIARNARFETLIASRFLGPLNLDDSLLLDRHPDLPALATGYEPGPRPLDLRQSPDPVILTGHDGLYTTAPDLVRLGQAVLQRRIDLFRPDGQMEAGWQVRLRDGFAIYSLSSAQPGYRTGILALSPTELVVAYAVNIDAYPAEALDELILDLAFNRAASLPVRPATAALDPALLPAVGTYESAILGTVELVQAEGGLDIRLPQSGRQDYLTPIGPDRLFWRRIGAELQLERDEAGRVIRITGHRITESTARPILLERSDLQPVAVDTAN